MLRQSRQRRDLRGGVGNNHGGGGNLATDGDRRRHILYMCVFVTENPPSEEKRPNEECKTLQRKQSQTPQPPGNNLKWHLCPCRARVSPVSPRAAPTNKVSLSVSFIQRFTACVSFAHVRLHCKRVGAGNAPLCPRADKG